MADEMKTTLSAESGQAKMWSIYPFDDDEGSVRVNQLVDTSQNPPVFLTPRIEVSNFWIFSRGAFNRLRSALDQAELMAFVWEENVGKSIYD